jgi:hypothetical protein
MSADRPLLAGLDPDAAIDAALDSYVLVDPPAGFTAAVMAQVAASPQGAATPRWVGLDLWLVALGVTVALVAAWGALGATAPGVAGPAVEAGSLVAGWAAAAWAVLAPGLPPPDLSNWPVLLVAGGVVALGLVALFERVPARPAPGWQPRT